LKDDALGPLLEQARARAPEALAELCERIYPDVLRYMRYRVGRDEAEDLTEEVFLRVVRSVGGQTGSFRAWLFRVASNVVTDWLRHKRVAERVRVDGEAVARSAGGSDPAAGAARRLDLADALAQLTDDQRELVTLKFLQGLSNAEIGAITGRTQEAVRALQFRALSALRGLLGDEDV
jgi:RNA polymerase sigma-70 factor (ECF subfamily)